MKLDINVAVNLNGGEQFGCDSYGNPVWAGNPKEAAAAAQDYNFLYGYYYDEFVIQVVRGRDLTRAEFKKEYRQYRISLKEPEE